MNQEFRLPASLRPSTAIRSQALLNNVFAYVQSDLSRKIVLRDVAEHCGVSVSTLTQLFQKQLGITFHQYLTQQRMEAARDMIAQGLPLEDVGRKLGYSDHSTFYRAFRHTYGVSPREYRRTLTYDPE